MSLHPNTTYIIHPKALDSDAIGVGPIPPIFPPPDVPIRLVSTSLRERWSAQPSGNNTYIIVAGKGSNPHDYKWFVKDENKLFATAGITSKPGSFRIESAGEDLYVIGLFGKDALLTLDKDAHPPEQFTFQPANGSDAQRFQFVPIERD